MFYISILLATMCLAPGDARAQSVTCGPIHTGTDLAYSLCQITNWTCSPGDDCRLDFYATRPAGFDYLGFALLGWQASFASGAHDLNDFKITMASDGYNVNAGMFGAHLLARLADALDDAPSIFNIYFHELYSKQTDLLLPSGDSISVGLSGQTGSHARHGLSLANIAIRGVELVDSGAGVPDAGFTLSQYGVDLRHAFISGSGLDRQSIVAGQACSLTATLGAPTLDSASCGIAPLYLEARPSSIQGTLTRRVASDPIHHQVGPFTGVDTVKIPGPTPAGGFSVLRQFDVHLTGSDASHVTSLSAGASSTDFDPATNEMHIHWLFDFPNDANAPYDFSATMQHILIK